jgi:hypothetical protein
VEFGVVVNRDDFPFETIGFIMATLEEELEFYQTKVHALAHCANKN